MANKKLTGVDAAQCRTNPLQLPFTKVISIIVIKTSPVWVAQKLAIFSPAKPLAKYQMVKW